MGMRNRSEFSSGEKCQFLQDFAETSESDMRVSRKNQSLIGFIQEKASG